MSGIDHALIYQARQFITGANVHMVNTWIFLYEKSSPDSADRRIYEKRLRTFVAVRNLNLAARLYAEAARSRSLKARRTSELLDADMTALPGRTTQAY